MELPEFAQLNGIPVKILSLGHFPDTVIVREVKSQKQYEVEIKTLSF